MKSFLEKIHLREVFTIELPVEKADFVNSFKKEIIEGDTSVFANPFKRIGRSEQKYIGHVDYNGFEIKTRRNPFQKRKATIPAKGTFTQLGKKLVVKADINSMYIYGKMFPLTLVGFLIIFFLILNNSDENTWFVLLFFFAYILFIMAMTYFSLRRAVKKMKEHLETDFMKIEKGIMKRR